MKAALLASAMGAALFASAAGADQYVSAEGNDTGGIIRWSCEAELIAREVADYHCSQWGKYARITSVHRQYGDYIGFSCLWTPYLGPYQIPAVATRASCNSAVTPHVAERRPVPGGRR